MKKLIVALVTCTVVAGMSLSAMPTFAQGDQASSSASSSSMSKKMHHHKKKSSSSASSSSSG